MEKQHIILLRIFPL